MATEEKTIVNVRGVSKNLYLEAQAKAIKNGLSRGELIDEAFKAYLGKNKNRG